MKAKVYVTLKSAVLDPQGQAVRGTLSRIGFEGVEQVRVGKLIELELKETDPARAKEQVEEMCKRLLSNPVMESYRVEVE